MIVCCTSACTIVHSIHIIVSIISSGRGAQKSVIVGRKRLDVAIDAAIVHNEGKTGRLPIFSILGLSVGTFVKLGFVKMIETSRRS